MKKSVLTLFFAFMLLFSTNSVLANSEIEYGKEYNESFMKESSSESQSFNFKLENASEVSIELQSDHKVTYTIQDANKQLAKTSVKGKETNTHDLEPGDYILTFSSRDAGEYSFTVTEEAANTDDIEPNNTMSEAQPLPLDTTISGFISLNDDADYYSFTLEEAGKVNVYIESFIDGYMYYKVTDESNNKIKGDSHNSSSVDPEKINNDFYLEPGTYYVAVYYSTLFGTGKYNITTDFTPAKNTEVEPNNGTAEAQTIEFGEVVNGFLSWNDSNDVYAIDVKQKSPITIHVNGDLTHNLYLKVRDNLDNVVFKDVYSPKSSTILETLNVEPGTYYIEASYNVSHAYGNYELYVTGDGITKFNDYRPDYWANAFAWGAKNNIINGDKKSNLLNPYRNITEAQWLAMLLRYAYDAEDSTSGQWYNAYYSLAKQQGIPVTNKPYEPLRRGTVASMLVKVYTGETLTERDAVQWLYDNEITTGVDPSKPKSFENFNPNGQMKRAQAITFMYRLYEKGITPQK